jgi:hypothetical protein
MDNHHAPRPVPQTWRRGALLLLALLTLLGGAAAWWWWPRRPPQPPAEDVSPYRNTSPEVRYVGDEACAGCHADKARTYRQHPMGRSFAPVAAELDRQRLDDKANNPFTALGNQFLVERRGQGVFHRVSYRDPQGRERASLEAEAHFAIGSGRQGRSYLVERDGYLFQSPISWYTSQQAWDVSPGFQAGSLEFERPIAAGCLFCHANDASPVEGTLNRYRPVRGQSLFRGYAVGCERCHGPGELHVQAQRNKDAEGATNSIVNPANLSPALRDAVCEQCHLQGEIRHERRGHSVFDYRPGLPLHRFHAVFVLPPERKDDYHSVDHVEQLRLSRCFQKSRGRLGCISCHDPHELPAEEDKVDFYRDRCLQCHGEKSCRLPPVVRWSQRWGDSCIACHMPRGDSSNIVHASATDHRIVRRADEPPFVGPGLTPDDAPLLPFHRDLPGVPPEEQQRDLALALVDFAAKVPVRLVQQKLGTRALPLLEAAVARAPEDVAAWQARAQALTQQGRLDEGLAAYRTALVLAPRREMALMPATELALRLDRTEEALDYAQRLLDVNPWPARYHMLCAGAHARRRDWLRAEQEARRALGLNPLCFGARMVLIDSLIHRGEKGTARAELETLLALNVPPKDELGRVFDELRDALHFFSLESDPHQDELRRWFAERRR